MSFLSSSFTHSPFTQFFSSLLSIGIDQFRWVEASSVILKFEHDDKYSKVQNVLRNVLCNLLAEVIFSFTTRAQDLKKKGGASKKKNEVIDSKPVQRFKERAYENIKQGKRKSHTAHFSSAAFTFQCRKRDECEMRKKKKQTCEVVRKQGRFCTESNHERVTLRYPSSSHRGETWRKRDVALRTQEGGTRFMR